MVSVYRASQERERERERERKPRKDIYILCRARGRDADKHIYIYIYARGRCAAVGQRSLIFIWFFGAVVVVCRCGFRCVEIVWGCRLLRKS